MRPLLGDIHLRGHVLVQVAIVGKRTRRGERVAVGVTLAQDAAALERAIAKRNRVWRGIVVGPGHGRAHFDLQIHRLECEVLNRDPVARDWCRARRILLALAVVVAAHHTAGS